MRSLRVPAVPSPETPLFLWKLNFPGLVGSLGTVVQPVCALNVGSSVSPGVGAPQAWEGQGVARRDVGERTPQSLRGKYRRKIEKWKPINDDLSGLKGDMAA